MTEKVQIVCRRCGSADVAADASARWNIDTQEWEVSATYDKGSTCEVCGGECRTDEVPLDKWTADRTEVQILEGKEVGVVFHDDEHWRGQVSDEDVGPLWTSRLLYDDPEEAKDAARRWVLREEED